MVRLVRVTEGIACPVIAKVETTNPGGSVKDRPAIAMIEAAEREGVLKKGGVITAQVGSQDKKPKQVEKWCNVLEKNFGNVKLSGSYVPSFDCKWNFASSMMR